MTNLDCEVIRENMNYRLIRYKGIDPSSPQYVYEEKIEKKGEVMWRPVHDYERKEKIRKILRDTNLFSPNRI